MKYIEIELDAISGGKEKHIIIDNEDGSFKSFPVDESNPDYQTYLNKDKPQTPLVIDEAPAE